MLTRRKFLYTGAGAAAVAAFGAEGFRETRLVEVKKIDIALSRLPQSFDGFTIAQLSDLHYEQHTSAATIRKSVDIVNSFKPDLIAVTGDFITVPMFKYHVRQAAKTAEPCAEVLRQLSAPMGVFAVLGNHDRSSDALRIIGVLKENGVPVLMNRSVPIERKSARIWITGVDDALFGEPDLQASLEKVPSTEAVVLLAHEPDFADEAASSSIDLQLSGHSHGGQIWIPGIGAPWLPPLARNYPRGLYKIGNLTLYTNIGIGTIRAPVRINCPPEVTLITLRAAENKRSL